MIRSTTAPTMPTVLGSLAAWVVALLASVWVATPTAVPAAATKAVSRTAVPVAVSQPKNARPTLTPPNSSFSRLTTSRRLLAGSPAAFRLSAPDPSRPGVVFVLGPVVCVLMSLSSRGVERETVSTVPRLTSRGGAADEQGPRLSAGYFGRGAGGQVESGLRALRAWRARAHRRPGPRAAGRPRGC